MIIGKVRAINIEEEIKSSYLDYAMSVIVSRALPDVRDGLKPVHRRILYAMDGLALKHTGPYRKSARVVGDVLGKYHPHSDTSVYDAMVRMAQDFSMRSPLVDGQGNFGSVDNDPPAAMRYTEVRLAPISEQMLLDIDKDTVDFMPNFDNSLKEPMVLPARLPNLLLNGSSGIAVGMATNIPPHNLGEVCDAIAYLIENPEATVNELTQFVKGPDFPTAGIILGRDGIQSAYATGHGKVVVRAKAHLVEDAKETGHRQIVITELPYQTNKAALVERMAQLVKDKKVKGISEIRDESDRQGMRLVIELRRDGQPQPVLNALYKHTAMQSSFFINMLALVDGQPRVISLKEALQYHIDFRCQVITRRSRFELKEAKAKAHILEGLKIALDNIDAVIATIRKSATAEVARQQLISTFSLSQAQTQAILDMPLRRLAGLERQKILDDYAEVLKSIAYLEELLANPRRILILVKEDAAELRAKYANPRRTEIKEQEVIEFSEEDLIPHQRVVVTLSNRGFVKRVLSQVYRAQHRGGHGIQAHPTREADAVRLLVVADTHDRLFFFTNRGKVFSLKCHEIPDSSRTGKGTAVVNLFPVVEGERVTAMVAVTDFKQGDYLLMATCCGEVKKTAVERFAQVRSSGLIAMDLEESDELVSVHLANGQDDIVLVTRKGQSIRFTVSELRASSRTSGGVRGIRLLGDDRVVSMGVVYPEAYLLIVTTRGFGKLTSIGEYPRQHRAGGGVKTFKVVEKTGQVIDAKLVSRSQQLMIISADGIITRTMVREEDPEKGGISIQGRSTQGVTLMRMRGDDMVVAIASFG